MPPIPAPAKLSDAATSAATAPGPRLTTQAAVFTQPGRPLELQQVPLTPPLPGWVRVRIRLATVCGSDLHTCQGHRQVQAPMVLGHEMVGEVDALPAGAPVRDFDGRPLKMGDRVIWSIAASCGKCYFCTHDLPQKCETLFKYGHETAAGDRILSGGFANHCYLRPGTAVFRLPDSLPDVVACPAACATATVAAAFRQAGDCRDQTVLIQGLGALGLTACAMARAAGARDVIGCDIAPAALERARAFGATETADSRDSAGLERLIGRLTAERGVDLALELSGAPQAMETGLRVLRIGGRTIWVGAVSPSREIKISPETLVRRQLTIHGSHNYQPADLQTALQFLTAQHTQFPFASLVAESVFSLASINEAIAYALAHRPPRVAIRPDRVEI